MTQAHAQDFERKRKPDVPEVASPFDRARTTEVESSDEEDEEEEDGSEAGARRAAEQEGDEGRRADEEDVQDAQAILRRHRSAVE